MTSRTRVARRASLRRPALAAPLRRARDYVALTRPRILLAVGAHGAGGAHARRRALARRAGLALLGVLLGTALLGGGCGALNAWWERDRDARMLRTQGRPLPTGRLAPREALGFGVAISSLGLALLYAAGGWLPVGSGSRRSRTICSSTRCGSSRAAPGARWSGGVAGAAAPLVADAAADGRIGIWGLVLFAIVFLWQPPHVWAIALYRKAEYAAAGFPMLPARVGNRATRRWMLAFAIALVPVTLLPWFGGALGPGYATIAAAGGACFMASIVAAQRADRDSCRPPRLPRLARLSGRALPRNARGVDRLPLIAAGVPRCSRRCDTRSCSLRSDRGRRIRMRPASNQPWRLEVASLRPRVTCPPGPMDREPVAVLRCHMTGVMPATATSCRSFR